MKPAPPRLFLRFFRWYCHPGLRDVIEGDLLEEYYALVAATGKRKAQIHFIMEVLLLFRPGIIRSPRGLKFINPYSMYQSYFKVGWRNLLRNKGYSLINIGGLAAGMAVAMLIGFWIYDELSFNTYHQRYDHIARVLRNGTLNGETFTSSYLPYPLAEEIRTQYGGNFTHVAMAMAPASHTLVVGETKLPMQGMFIEPAGPDLFSLDMLEGSTSGLDDPHTVLLSNSAARILFGDESPMGRQLTVGQNMEVKVTGIYKDLPRNTDLQGVQFFAPFELVASVNPWIKQQGFGNNFAFVYVGLKDPAAVHVASASIRNAIINHIQDDKNYVTVNPEIFLHPMKKWHLWAEWKNGVNSGGLIRIVWLFGITGTFVLLLACINFMNLSTARSEKRAREVGIRKVVGSLRRQLIGQFFSESFLVALLAFVCALLIVSLSMDWFNNLAQKKMEIPLNQSYFWLVSLAFVLLTGLLAGSYPAFYLSAFKPVSVLKGSFRAGKLASLPRKILVVVQFTVSVMLITGTLVVYRQVQFGKDRPLGYEPHGLLMIQRNSPDFYGKYDLLEKELMNTGVVAGVAESSSPPTDIWNTNGGFDWRGKDPGFIAEFATISVTHDYGKTAGWHFTHGRDFSKELASDSATLILNTAAANILGFENPLGEIVQWSNAWGSRFSRFTVIGVIDDVVMRSPYAPPVPTAYFVGNTGAFWMNIRMDPRMAASEALPKIESVFKAVMPAVPFDYKFADQEYALKFAAEERIGKLAFVFAALAILISCLGLFGLSAFVAAQRTKEIGIRKVVGASVFSLWKMLSKDFVMLVAASCVIATPLAYFLLGTWLEQYEYRTAISWWVFALTSAVALTIALLTVSYQAIKAAMMRPVESLRTE